MEIRIKKGLDINLPGAAHKEVASTPCVSEYAVQPTDYVGIVPKLLVTEGDVVSAGDPLFYDKRLPQVMFSSPVDGVVKAVVRGEKRKLLAVVVASEEKEATELSSNEECRGYDGTESQLREAMCHNGLWTVIRQRPFGLVANPDETPKAIFVSACESYPLAPEAKFVLKGREQDFVIGLQTLSRLTPGKVHLSVREERQEQDADKNEGTQEVPSRFFDSLADGKIQVHTVSGPHPSGNVGVQIARINPINKGELVWTVQLQDVAVIGHWVRTGVYHPIKRVALAGPDVRMPRYYDMIAGTQLRPILEQQLKHKEGERIVSGDVLSGTSVGIDGYLGARDTLVTVIPEGDYYDFMGWLMPGIKKYSFSHTFLSGFTANTGLGRCITRLSNLAGVTWVGRMVNDFEFNTNMHGSVRPLVVTGQFEKVFPFDIYPMQLIKACIIKDIELMEDLGIYEVEPEDFALCEFIDTSKTEIQAVVREALEYIRNN